MNSEQLSKHSGWPLQGGQGHSRQRSTRSRDGTVCRGTRQSNPVRFAPIFLHLNCSRCVIGFCFWRKSSSRIMAQVVSQLRKPLDKKMSIFQESCLISFEADAVLKCFLILCVFTVIRLQRQNWGSLTRRCWRKSIGTRKVSETSNPLQMLRHGDITRWNVCRMVEDCREEYG